VWKFKEKLKGVVTKETGAVVKDFGGKASVLLVYPNEYAIGMGNLAVHSIYGMLNDREDVVCERAFLPSRGDLNEIARGDGELLSLESQRPASDFDAIAFTISFENDYLNILPMLSLAKMPSLARDRGASSPVIVAGGAAPTINPLPISEIFDVIFIGEFEEYYDEFCNVITGAGDKAEIISEFARMEGVFVPREGRGGRAVVGEAVSKRRFLKNLDEFRTQTRIYSDAAEFGDMHLIEAQRGCPRMCKFCATPAAYFPPRQRSGDAIVEMARGGRHYRARFGLIGADILSHPEFVEIAEAMHAMDATFSPSSVRADAIDEVKARLLAESGHRSISLGIEAGSERLRDALGKRTPDAKIIDAASTLARAGITRLRLYFMIGLPGERDEDLLAIAAVAKKIEAAVRSHAPKGSGNRIIDITISPFIPKPGTQFAKEPFVGEARIKSCVRAIKSSLIHERGMRLHFDSAMDARVEYELSNAASGMHEFLAEAAAHGVKMALGSYKNLEG
jgi:radical SAM superfamily enzyme YgiQ (UPF0313 family)